MPKEHKRTHRSRYRHKRSVLPLAAALFVLLSTYGATAFVYAMHGRSHLLLARAVPRRIARPTPRPVQRPPAVHPYARYLVLLVLDGARPDYFDLTPLPHLDALRRQGTEFTTAMDGILESETPSGHATLATGSTPAVNGILGFDWERRGSNYSLFSPNIVRSGAMERIMQSAGAPTIAGLYKQRFPTARVVALSGHKYYAADPLGGPAADAIMYYQGGAHGKYIPVAIPGHIPPRGVLNAPGVVGPNTHLGDGGEDHLATKLALRAFAVMHQRITLINYPEFDWPIGHVYGGTLDRARVIHIMKLFDRDLGTIEDAYRKAGILNQTLFVITADHGMTPVEHFIPQWVVSGAISEAGTTAPAASYNTGAYLWLADPSRAWKVATNILAAKYPGVESVYYLARPLGKAPRYHLAGGIPRLSSLDRANRYLLQTLANGHQPDVVAFCRPGYTMSPAITNWKGDHGGANWQSQHIPLVLSGPGIRSGVVSHSPAQLEDVAPTLLTAMHVPPTRMEGNVLTEALDMASPPTDSSRRQKEVDLLQPMVRALVADDPGVSSAMSHAHRTVRSVHRRTPARRKSSR